MYMDFHTHGKLAKYLPFSTEYTDWLLREARRAGLDAICLTEHFNTQQFDTLYGYIEARGQKNGDAGTLMSLKTRAGCVFFPVWRPTLRKAGMCCASARWRPSGR